LVTSRFILSVFADNKYALILRGVVGELMGEEDSYTAWSRLYIHNRGISGMIPLIPRQMLPAGRQWAYATSD
jgi:hypothetical protein